MTAPATDRGVPAPAAGGQRWRSRAFGLELGLSFEAPGLPPAGGAAPEGPHTTVDLAPADEIERDWPEAETERLLEERFDDPEPARTIDRHPRAGYRLYARHFGLARVAPDGSSVVCAPPEDEPWSWQRFLVGRVLPWAAVLSGREVLHASAVALAGDAVAFVGDSGAGKTSLAVRLVGAGARFVTDDVLAIDRGPGGLLRAHPGASIVAVRPAERATIPPESWRRLGVELGESGKTYLALPRVDEPVPLRAVCFVGRDANGPQVERLDGVSPRELLASTFVTGVQTPERLLNQLELCAAMAHSLPFYRLRVRPGCGAERLAGAVAEVLA